eukprot:CAMPEP_0181135752 /NCGR_PEP_ID=MMETSP1071-20121207/32821_1 /TAXON_ID=35127 /ORGANISM="Thalassiosira sp., Strain NH16" /LENGTH=49 /DNA_ID= /DNA_START= /DNA_END= /DNA_ORIENTATION=
MEDGMDNDKSPNNDDTNNDTNNDDANNNDDDDVLKVLLSTDNHLGYLER